MAADTHPAETPVRLGPGRVLHPPAPGPRWAYVLAGMISALLVGLGHHHASEAKALSRETSPATVGLDADRVAHPEFAALTR